MEVTISYSQLLCNMKTKCYIGFFSDTTKLANGIEQRLRSVTYASKRLTSRPLDHKLVVKPYQRKMPDVDNIEVYIHGHLRGFHLFIYCDNSLY